MALLGRLKRSLLGWVVLTLGCQQTAEQPVVGPEPPVEVSSEDDTGLWLQKVAARPGQTAAVPPLTASAKTENERNTIDVFEAAAPATVFVANEQHVRLNPFSRQTRVVSRGTGSGFIWDRKGHVVTNFHVVQGRASVYSITLRDHRLFEAKLVGVEARKDIAVLRIVNPPKDLVPMRVVRGLRLRVGQKALAIGNPFGLDQTLTTGVISALGRSMTTPQNVTIRDMVQTDAAINPGNSGGPLLDSQGQLIGMNSMIASPSGAAAGVGFAVPVSAIARIVPQIIRTGKAEQVDLGMRVDFQQRMMRRRGSRGFIILKVDPKGPADRAGLKGVRVTRRGWRLGDVLVGIGDKRIENYDDYYNALDLYRAGDRVEVHVLRGAQKKRITTTVELVKL